MPTSIGTEDDELAPSTRKLACTNEALDSLGDAHAFQGQHSLLYTRTAPSGTHLSMDLGTVVMHQVKSCNIEPAGFGCKKNGAVIPTLFSGPTITSSDLFSPPSLQYTSSEESLIIIGELSPRPHSPPVLGDVGQGGARGAILHDRAFNSQRISHDRNYHRQTVSREMLMEERLARWRPSLSQQAVDASMNGTHPFQSDQFKCPTKTRIDFPLVDTLKGWLWPNTYMKHDSTSQQSPSYAGLQLTTKDKNKLAILRSLATAHLGASSESMVLCRDKGHALVLPHSLKQPLIIDLEPGPSGEMQCTPKAAPFNDFELNFDKSSLQSRPVYFEDQADNEDIMNLLGSEENFLMTCFYSTWTWMNSIHC